ncbi:MAG: SPOR domain-containing protein [Alistipes senegalensis]|nr:SPOR domain-containing protein [Oxalobacter formigenes]MCM1281419.1 SPOR domain-containing protein [Alistipes senegalensis]
MSLFSFFRRKKPDEAAGTGLQARADSVAQEGAVRQKNAIPPEGEDPILPEKKRARRRLVGAVTITLAGIIVLPMIFESEPQTVSQDIMVDIPSRDKPPQTVSREPVKKKTEEKTAVPDTAKEAAKPVAPVLPEKKEAKPKPAEMPPARPAADNSREQPKQDAAKPEPRTTKPESREPAKPESKAATAKKGEDPIGQIIAKQQAASKPGGQAKVVIQVAAVSSPDKAKDLQDKLKKAGLTSYTQKVALKEGGERIRIRIGPLTGGKEVNQTCAKLSQLKLPCTLVN